MEQGNLAATDKAGKKVPILKITKGKLGMKTKKRATDEDPNAIAD